MKLRLLMFFGLLACLFGAAQAQTSASEVAFANAKGELLAPNATLHLNEVQESPFFPGQKQMLTQLFLLNTSEKTQKVKISYEIISIEEGQLQVCALGNCTLEDAVGTYEVGEKALFANGEKEEIKVDYSFTTKGKCAIKLQLTILEEGENGKVVEKAGPTVTLHLDAEGTGITGASQTSGAYNVYNTQGVLLHKNVTSLQNLSKGIYIVQQKDAKGRLTTQKHIIP